MSEEIIIKATPKPFKTFPFILMLLPTIWLLFSYSLEFQDLYVINWIILIVFCVIAVIISAKAVELTITNKTVSIYNPVLKNSTDLPVDSISTISKTTIFTEGISVSTSSGQVTCCFIGNRDAVFSELKKLIDKRQDSVYQAPSSYQSTPTMQSNANSADELMKYKQLLDSGIITQEEFDAKKKQLLGL